MLFATSQSGLSILNGKVTLNSYKSTNAAARDKGFTDLTACYAGAFDWGPVDQRVLISNPVELMAVFGQPTLHNIEDFMIVSNFLSYNSQIWVMRTIEKLKSGVSVAYFNGSQNAFLGIKSSDVGGTITTDALADIILNSDDYIMKRLISNFPAFQADEIIRFYAKYPSVLGNDIKVAVANYTDFATQAVTSAINFVDLFDADLSATEIAIVVLDDNDTILEKFIVTTVQGVKNANGNNYYVDDFISRNSRFINTVSNSALFATKSVDSIAATNLVKGFSVPVASYVDTLSIDTGTVTNLAADYDLYLNKLSDLGFNLMLDSFQASNRAIKLYYDNTGIATEFVALKHKRVQAACYAHPTSIKTVYKLFYIRFDNADNAAPIMAGLILDAEIFAKVGGVILGDNYIRAKIVDTPNDYNFVVIEAPETIITATNLYLDAAGVNEIVFNVLAVLHDGDNAISDRINVQDEQFDFIGGTEITGVFSMPNFFTINSKDNAIDYMATLISHGRYVKNAVFYLECQNEEIPITIETETVYVIPNVGDIAGSWSTYNFVIKNNNAMSYAVIPYGNDVRDVINELSKCMVNTVDATALTMSVDSVANDAIRYAAIRVYLNKVKADLREVMQRNVLFYKSTAKVSKAILAYRNKLLADKSKIVSNLVYNVFIEEDGSSVTIKCRLYFNQFVDYIDFEIVQNV